METIDKAQQIKQWIYSTMEQLELTVELVQKDTGVNMTYDFIHDHIGVDVKRVQQANEELTTPIALESYIKILTMHELGHAVDREALLASLPRTIEIYEMKKSHSLAEQYSDPQLLAMRIEEHEMNIAFEETAWANAEALNKKSNIADTASFEKVKSHSLMTYTNLLERDLRLYNELAALHTEQIA